jgi:hypothetical protein
MEKCSESRFSTGGTLINNKTWVISSNSRVYDSKVNSTSVTPCKFFASGSCKYGSNCSFAHQVVPDKMRNGELEISVYFTGMPSTYNEQWLREQLQSCGCILKVKFIQQHGFNTIAGFLHVMTRKVADEICSFIRGLTDVSMNAKIQNAWLISNGQRSKISILEAFDTFCAPAPISTPSVPAPSVSDPSVSAPSTASAPASAFSSQGSFKGWSTIVKHSVADSSEFPRLATIEEFPKAVLSPATTKSKEKQQVVLHARKLPVNRFLPDGQFQNDLNALKDSAESVIDTNLNAGFVDWDAAESV